MKLSFYIAAFCLVFVWGIRSAEGQGKYRFRNLSVDQGLHNSTVYAISQDKHGIMMFALRDGIDKYDGYDFKHYDLLPADSLADFDIKVRSLFRDNSGRIYAGAGSRLFLYDNVHDVFRELCNISNANINRYINVIHGDLTGRIWLGTNRGVVIYDPASDSTLVIPDFYFPVLSFYVGNHHNMWIGSNKGLYLYDMKKNGFISQTSSTQINQRLKKIQVFSYYGLDHHRILLGTSDGLWMLNPQHGTLREIQITSCCKRSYVIRDIVLYDHNFFLLGTDGCGLLVTDSLFRSTAHYYANEDDPQSLSNNGIYDVHIDLENRIWIATYGGGISLYDPNLKSFRVIRHIPYNRNSLGNNNVRSILEDTGGKLWFGTKQNISILDRKTGSWKHINTENNDLQEVGENIVLCLTETDKHRVWAGTFSNGVFIYDENGKLTGHLKNDPRDTNSIGTNYVYAITTDTDGNIWLGGIHGLLTRYNPQTKKARLYRPITNIRSILETSLHHILVGTKKGIYINKHGSDKFVLLKTGIADSKHLLKQILCIHETTDHKLWVGTEGNGLIYLDSTGKFLKRYTQKEGLPSNYIQGVLEDTVTGNLWISTSNGISEFVHKKNEFINFSVSDGLSSREFFTGVYYKTREGEMIFGGINGVTIFKPEEIKLNTQPPSIVFSDFFVFNKSFRNMGKEAPAIGNINNTKEIILKHNQNSISVAFAAINYTSTGKNLYRWKLEGLSGLENQWSYPTTQRIATYTNLRPGHYKFFVQASNNDGVWNRKGRKLSIVVRPPFWMTPVAILIYITIFVLLSVAVHNYIIIRIRETQSQKKIKFFINIAHDIRTPLTLIRGSLHDLKNNQWPSPVRKSLHLIDNNVTRLNNLVRQLLDFQKADMGKMQLKVIECDLDKLLREIIDTFEPWAEEKNITIQYQSHEQVGQVWLDKSKIERIMYNLLSNAIKYSYENGIVEVILNTGNMTATVKVIDHGMGIPASQKKIIFNRYFRSDNVVNKQITGSGIGLMLTRKLVKLHKGSISFKSEEGKGSEFSFQIPINREAYSSEELYNDIKKEKLTTVREVLPEEKTGIYHVLVVEDSDELREYLKDNLCKYYKVTVAVNGKEGLSEAHRHNFDLIVSDVMMPEMDGIEFCSRIRKNIHTSHIPFILLTALNSVQSKILSMEYGADDYIEKPFDIDYLKARIDNLLHTRELLRNKYLSKPETASSSAGIRNKMDAELMRKLVKVVSESYQDENFSVEVLCRELGVSRPVLYRKLKAYTNKSPQDFIKIYRLKKAEEMLTSGQGYVKEIAYTVGFSNPKYFSVSFKKFFGKSPKDFFNN